MPTCKITVLKKMYNPELANIYRRSDVHQGACPYYTEGQEFFIEHLGERPSDFFCDWAWNDLYKFILVMMTGGDFSPWMKDGNKFIACCTDGIKPVIFKLERIENNGPIN
jgi:uncharacterized repeat protein (TIGR04076 family)